MHKFTCVSSQTHFGVSTRLLLFWVMAIAMLLSTRTYAQAPLSSAGQTVPLPAVHNRWD